MILICESSNYFVFSTVYNDISVSYYFKTEKYYSTNGKKEIALLIFFSLPILSFTVVFLYYLHISKLQKLVALEYVFILHRTLLDKNSIRMFLRFSELGLPERIK